MPLTIAPASHADVSVLAAIGTQGFSETFGHLYKPDNLAAHLIKTCSEDFFHKALENGDEILLAHDGDTAVGYVKGGYVGLPVSGTARGAREIHRLYVLSPYQGRAIGTAMLDKLLALPSFTGAPEIYVGVWSENLGAQRFYSRYGFEKCGDYTYHVGTDSDHEFIYKRKQSHD